MGVIKTALEIALEKTEMVKSDKSGIEQFEIRQRGKKLANTFLAGGVELTDALKKTPKDQKESLKQGIFDILVTQITLPAAKEDKDRVERAGKGLAVVIDNNHFSAMFKQLMQVVDRYLQEASHYEQAVRQQYAPRLRKKEEELSRRLGRDVRIDPMQDPEFIAFYNQHITALKANYEPFFEQAKAEAQRLFKG